MKQTPLYNWHLAHGGKMVEFGGYLMPVSYEGVLAEHQAVRERCGLFDISHMGEIYVEGPEAEATLQWVTTNDVKKLSDGRAQYSLLLNEEGGVVDDIIVYRLAPQNFLLCVNASNIQKDFEWLQKHLREGVKLDNRSDQMGMVALQGPKTFQVLSRLGIDLKKMDRFQFAEIQVKKIPVLLSRTGYTGEEGCEFFLKNEDLVALWEILLAAGEVEGIAPIGLGARDTLRLEMGYPLYGHEINDGIPPLEAGLGWVVKWDKGDFLGRAAILPYKEKGHPSQLVGLRMEEPGIPREGLKVLSGEEVIGEICSGTFSPSLKVGIATALIQKAKAPASGEIFIDIRGKMKKAKLVTLPFLRRPSPDLRPPSP